MDICDWCNGIRENDEWIELTRCNYHVDCLMQLVDEAIEQGIID